MAEDWNAVAAEVEDALRSVSDVSQADGYPVTIRVPGASTGPAYDPTPGSPSYHTFYCVDTNQRLRDADGTLIDMTTRTLMVNATGPIVPDDGYSVAIGIAAGDATESSDWIAIKEVRTLAPAGVALMHEIDLVD